MSGYTLKEVLGKKIPELLIKEEEPGFGLDKIYEITGDVGRTVSMEAKIICKHGELRDVVLNISRFSMMGKDGIILVTKDITRKERVEKETSQLMMEIQSSILLMNLPVTSYVREPINSARHTTIREAADKMQRKNQDCILISGDRGIFVGIITDKDLRNRVVAANYNLDAKVVEIMSSPLIRISDESLLYETILLIKEKGISHLAVENRTGEVIGIFSNEDLLEVHRNSISYLIKEVGRAETIEVLKAIHNKVPGLVETLLNSGAKIQNVTHMISSITDAITHRLIDFARDEMGEPPAAFAFLALGSEGRREQTLVTDQDNAIVFEDVDNDKLGEVSRYFLYFGKKINLWLDRLGYQYCKGEIMAGNPQ